MIDWTIYDNYEYSEGDGVYLDEKSLRNGVVKTTNVKQSFVNIKHPHGQHLINVARNIQNKKDLGMRMCWQCCEYTFVSTCHEGIETIPLCDACVED